MWAHIARYAVTEVSVQEHVATLVAKLKLSSSPTDGEQWRMREKLCNALKRKCKLLSTWGIVPAPGIVSDQVVFRYPPWVCAWAEPNWDGDIREPRKDVKQQQQHQFPPETKISGDSPVLATSTTTTTTTLDGGAAALEKKTQPQRRNQQSLVRFHHRIQRKKKKKKKKKKKNHMSGHAHPPRRA